MKKTAKQLEQKTTKTNSFQIAPGELKMITGGSGVIITVGGGFTFKP